MLLKQRFRLRRPGSSGLYFVVRRWELLEVLLDGRHRQHAQREGKHVVVRLHNLGLVHDDVSFSTDPLTLRRESVLSALLVHHGPLVVGQIRGERQFGLAAVPERNQLRGEADSLVLPHRSHKRPLHALRTPRLALLKAPGPSFALLHLGHLKP
eukprot:1193422-Prorocentrum_minimum.AAC.11